MKFNLAIFCFLIKAIDPLSLPIYKGSTFRGGFGHSFKKVVCALREKNCNECPLKEKCVYSYIFETPPPANTRIMRKYPYAPHPFIIDPPLDDKTEYVPGEELAFKLTLIGRSIDYLSYFIYTFNELGSTGIGKRRGKYQLLRVSNFNGKGDETIIYNDEDKILLNKYHVIYALELERDKEPLQTPQEIKITFLTPTRIKYNGRYIRDLEFHVLIRNLLRRISLLSYFHCAEELELDFKGLISQAKKVSTKDRHLNWYDWERYSARQDERMKLGGFMGNITFEGELKPFLTFLYLGELIHVGKGTGFGLGRYRIN